MAHAFIRLPKVSLPWREQALSPQGGRITAGNPSATQDVISWKDKVRIDDSKCYDILGFWYLRIGRSFKRRLTGCILCIIQFLLCLAFNLF